ncbi:MAG: alanine--tRNA ligase [Planctomycetia bacterium]|nr:alanine--tRNA ligase [Planctomycetia bacterium]
MRSANQIRQEFIDFFCQRHGHTFVPSSSVVPLDDPTLQFSNAGMNQFKDVFLGTGSRAYRRAANTQKCIRAGGKHNDLDDVGKDTYHHTFFEMLGNWSFGDYFKKEAIRWAWELLTEVWGLDRTRLHATVFEGSPSEGVPRDDEAAELWRSETDINPDHIHWGNKKDNFWEMGETGPCGPCTEIHIDRTPDKNGKHLVNKGSDQAIEIWNLVFIQFNRNSDRSLTLLPAKHVDTGMGFERVTSVIQGKASNYDTDVFTPIFQAIQKTTGAPAYGGKLTDLRDIAYRVIADHIRMLTFALTDGAVVGNVGRGSVLKRVLRRAERYGRQYLGTTKPYLCELVSSVVGAMGEAFPELNRQPDKVAAAIQDEEESFLRTLDRGMKLFNEAAERTKASGRTQISGVDAFTLQGTYGVYLDITQQMAGEIGLTVDVDGFEEERIKDRLKAQQGRKRFEISAIKGEVPRGDDSPKYGPLTATGSILGWVKDGEVVRSGQVYTNDEVGLLLDRTNFYAEQGGQTGDSGSIKTMTGTFEVDETRRLGDAVLHLGRVVEGHIEAGQPATLEVSTARPHIQRNHTTTHLLNWALREVLGDGVDQKGSLVDAEKTRFDFSYDKPLSPEQVAEIERLVNEKIYADLPVTPVVMPLGEAKKIPGLRAVFGEKYPDPVRVVLIGATSPDQANRSHSVEFCGGTHLTHTGEAGFFKVLSQEGVAKGVRRITATTGRGAVNAVQAMAKVVERLTSTLGCKPDEVAGRVEALQEEVKKLAAQLKKGAASDLNAAVDALFVSGTDINGAKLLVGEVPAAPIDQMRTQMDRLRQKAKSAVILLGWVDEGKVGLMAAVTDDLTGKVEAGKLVGEAAKAVGGKGGGRKDLAQAGGTQPEKLKDAFDAARMMAMEKLR